MTNEEAIFELGYAKDFQTPKRKEAIDMAIEVLENYAEISEALNDYAELYRKLKTKYNNLKEQTQWIPCSERLPKKDEEVFVYLFRNQPYIAWHDGIDWCTEDFTVDKGEEPTAWMPLPKAYEGRKE